MDVVLISTRGRDGVPHWSRACACELAARLLQHGARVQWLCPLGDGEAAPAAAAGVRLDCRPGRVPPFRRVLARIADSRTDVALVRALRPLRRAVVVHVGFGAPGSAATLWLADRMGADAIGVVRADEVVCHRGTLVDATGAPCVEFTAAARCAQCVCAPWPGRGLTPLQSRWAKGLRRLRGWSPFPTESAFLSRSDLVLGSLLVATVVVGDAVQREQLCTAGLPPRNVRAIDGLDGTAVAALVAAHCTVAAPAG